MYKIENFTLQKETRVISNKVKYTWYFIERKGNFKIPQGLHTPMNLHCKVCMYVSYNKKREQKSKKLKLHAYATRAQFVRLLAS